MKKIFTIALFIGITNCIAQDVKQIFTATEIAWYGLDFTKAKFVGGFDQAAGIAAATGSDMKSKWIPAWNSLILSEPNHFDLRKVFRKDNVYNDLNPVTELNSKIDPDECMGFNPTKISQAEIEEMVKKYNGDKKDGIGLSFIVENFNKGSQMADVYVTFFDIASKKVLLSEKVSGKAVGIGMRNYWAGAIKDILKQIDSSHYKNWKNKK
ncbi:MAG: hypothetical protein M3R27_09090 [Bacteroidota bacterium]|nr:hypothetical protein [Bacteroidota bacterium]